jgi:hypothetical protein
LITGEGKCVGGAASTNQFNLTAPFTDYFLTNEPLKNGGSSMECWNPKDGVSVSCGNGEWSCKVMSIKRNPNLHLSYILNVKILNILNK